MFGHTDSFGPAFGITPLCPHAFFSDRSCSSTPSSASSGEVSCSTDPSFGAYGTSAWTLAGPTAATPAEAYPWQLPMERVPALPMFTAAVPLSQGCCTVADMNNLQLSAQLLLDPIRGPTRAQAPLPPARELLGLGGFLRERGIEDESEATPAAASDAVPGEAQLPPPVRPAPTRAPVVNRWLCKHPILGSILAPDAAHNPCAIKSPPRSPLHKSGGLPAIEDAEGVQTAELLALVRQLVEDTKRRDELEEHRASRHAAELEHDRSAAAAAAEASAAAAAEVRAAAERCADAMDREEARRQAASDCDESGRKAAASEEASRHRVADEAHRRQVVLAAVSRWSVMEGSNLANCCLQGWRALVTETISERKAQAAHLQAIRPSSSASIQTNEAELAASMRMQSSGADAEDAAPAFGAAGVPPTVPGGALRALRGEQVWLQVESGAITGAALWLSQMPPKASRKFVRTFDICLPWAEVEAWPDRFDEASSTTTVDPASFLADNVLAPPGSFLRSEPLSMPSSPIHAGWTLYSKPGSPTSVRSAASSPAHSRRGSRSPARSPARSVPRSPAASRASLSLFVDAGPESDGVTASQVLQRISGLMGEMTAMEASLGNLREELDKEGSAAAPSSKGEAATDTCMAVLRTSLEGAGPLSKRAPGRLRQRLPEGVARLEGVSARAPPPRVPPAPVRRSSSAACASRRNAISRSTVQRGRPPFQAALSSGAGRPRASSDVKRPTL